MEDKIEVGEYVRFANGKIIKCTNSYSDKIISNHSTYKNKDIVKHHKNITDLVEKGDYVNGKEVIAIKGEIELSNVHDENDIVYIQYVDEYGVFFGLKEKDIKSVVTKEQFNSIKYEIPEEK